MKKCYEKIQGYIKFQNTGNYYYNDLQKMISGN
jgi:hypothetical protein